MHTFPSAFSDALSVIEINGAKRAAVIAAHQEVRGVLLGDPQLGEWGLEPVLTGSYARDTAIYPGNDVDIFGRLQNLGIDVAPSGVYDHFAEVLQAKYSDRVDSDPPRRAVKVDFSQVGPAFSIDVVPAVVWGADWGIPNRDRARWVTGSERWVRTNPLRLNTLTSDRNRTPRIDGDGAYVPTVKLLRQVRSYHLGEARPNGLFFELMAYWAFDSGIAGGSFAELLAAALVSCVAQLTACLDGAMILDPALLVPLSPPPSPQELSNALTVFTSLAEDVQEALAADDECIAAAVWRRTLGRNERGHCFPLPDGCDEDGGRIESISSIRSRGSAEAGRYGAD